METFNTHQYCDDRERSIGQQTGSIISRKFGLVRDFHSSSEMPLTNLDKEMNCRCT